MTSSINLIFVLCFVSFYSCSKQVEEPRINDEPEQMKPSEMLVEGVDYFLPHIDLSNWKVTLPVGNPSEVSPPEILDYANNTVLQEFMYNDSTDGSLVFYTYPGSTTPNARYSRTELREQMVPGSNNTNWKFSEGGIMEGELAVTDVSQDANGKDHRIIIMQIHGRLTNAQRDAIGEDDNNAPPVLKIYWDKGKVRVKTKVLINDDVDDLEILRTSSWTDDDGYNFPTLVNHDKFKLRVEVSFGKIVVTLNDSQSRTYESEDLKRWDIFTNYFKAGNYLQTTDSGANAKVKYYSLEVVHP